MYIPLTPTSYLLLFVFIRTRNGFARPAHMDQVEKEFPRIARASRWARQRALARQRSSTADLRGLRHKEISTAEGGRGSRSPLREQDENESAQMNLGDRSVRLADELGVVSAYGKVDEELSRISRELQALLTRGAYLSQQTMLDVESSHKATFAELRLADLHSQFQCDSDMMVIDDSEGTDEACSASSPVRCAPVGSRSMLKIFSAQGLWRKILQRKVFRAWRTRVGLREARAAAILSRLGLSGALAKRALPAARINQLIPSPLDLLSLKSTHGAFYMAARYQRDRTCRVAFARILLASVPDGITNAG